MDGDKRIQVQNNDNCKTNCPGTRCIGATPNVACGRKKAPVILNEVCEQTRDRNIHAPSSSRS